MLTPEGSVWEVGTQELGWKELEDGEEITGEHFLRLNISTSVQSGVASFDIIEYPGTYLV